jgi:hypothetical protein
VSTKIQKVILIGDEQSKPYVFSIGSGEYSAQLELSLFQRLKDLGGTPVYMFNVDNCIHRRIISFPGMVTHGWLGSADCTKRESPAYKAVYEYYVSHAATSFREARIVARDTEIASAREDCRRLFFNVRGCRSAPAVGRSSIRNYGTINAVKELLDGLLNHQGQYTVAETDITIVTAYNDQKAELSDNLDRRVRRISLDDPQWRVTTVDYI